MLAGVPFYYQQWINQNKYLFMYLIHYKINIIILYIYIYYIKIIVLLYLLTLPDKACTLTPKIQDLN